jgi:hypothetical protein
VQPKLEDHAVVGRIRHDPVPPAGQPVDGVALVRLVEGQAQVPSLPAVTAATYPVRPGEKGLAAGRRAHLVDVVTIDDLDTGGPVAP